MMFGVVVAHGPTGVWEWQEPHSDGGAPILDDAHVSATSLMEALAPRAELMLSLAFPRSAMPRKA